MCRKSGIRGASSAHALRTVGSQTTSGPEGSARLFLALVKFAHLLVGRLLPLAAVLASLRI